LAFRIEASMSASARWLTGIAIAVAAVVVASVVLAITLDDSETTFDPGTPAATVQAYFRGVQDRDIESAFALLTTDLRGRCSAEELRRTSLNEPSFSVRIRESTERDQVAEIDVRIGIGGGDLPFGGGYDVDRVMVLQREDGEWRIAEPPWPLWWCPEAPPRSSERRGEVS
jgi:hypothetical protein